MTAKQRAELTERLRIEQKIADNLDRLHAKGLATDKQIRQSENRLDRLVRLLAE